MHYERQRRTGDVGQAAPMLNPATGVCQVKDCQRAAQKRNFCGMHYRRVQRTGDHGDAAPTRILGDDERRFWSYVDKNGPIHPRLGTRCWIWTGAKSDLGYGRFNIHGTAQAHRYSYELASGKPLVPGLDVDHRCHQTSCVRPDHLRDIPHKQNQEHRRGATRSSTSGVRGVTWEKRRNHWVATVTHYGKSIYVGSFNNLADAEAAVIAKRVDLFTHNDLDRLVVV